MKRTEQIDRWQKIVECIVADYKRIDHAQDAAMKAGCFDPNGQLCSAMSLAWDGMLDRVDVDGWIAWFIYENECGKKKLAAKGCGKRGKRPIKTARQLATLIVESEEFSGMK